MTRAILEAKYVESMKKTKESAEKKNELEKMKVEQAQGKAIEAADKREKRKAEE
jgi:hypothetical protein